MPLLETGDNCQYYVPALIEAYFRLPADSEEAIILRKKLRANIGDDDTFSKLLENENARLQERKEVAEQSMMETIDNFLDKFAPAKKPTGYLQEKTDEKSIKSDILRQLIQNQRYEEALEIIERQNLNNTQKNIYFAHQIRFLRKLMAIEKHKQTAAKSAK